MVRLYTIECLFPNFGGLLRGHHIGNTVYYTVSSIVSDQCDVLPKVSQANQQHPGICAASFSCILHYYSLHC